MASSTNAANAGVSNNGKRKKSRGSKGSYLSKWLDKTMQHIQDSTPSMDTYDPYINPNLNWPGNSQFTPGFDPYRYNAFGCTPEPMSLPTMPTYGSPATVPQFYTPEYRYPQGVNKSIQVQRPRMCRRKDNKAVELDSTPKNNMLSNNPSMLQPKNFTDSQDFASLPPIVTSVGDTNSNSDLNTNEKEDNSNARRFSDPCVQGLPDIAQPGNGEMDSDSESGTSTSGSQVGSRLLTCLLDQITGLKHANERLSKELMETKMELDSLRQQTMLFQKGTSPNMGAAGGCTPLSNLLMSGQYSPGFVTDIVREIRDSARLREEAMYSRVRAMLLERTDSGMASSESKYSEKAIEEIKSSLRTSESDKRRMMDRINKLEDELRDLKLNSCPDNAENKLTNGNTESSETECMRLRKELVDAKKKKQNAEDHALKLERLVTQLRSKFNGLHLAANGPDSLSSDAEHDHITRPRRTSTGANSSANSTANSTVVFGPVTDL